MMVTIVFETHATTVDNEAHISSGHFDVGLSELGLTQTHELGQRYKDDHFDAIFRSDLQRTFKTAEIAFAGGDLPMIKDPRLHGCDYGALTRHPSRK